VTETYDWYESSGSPDGEIEAMVRAAGQYVRASDDLRPRVLETARAQCGERRAQRCIRHVALFVVLAAVFTLSDGRGLDSASAPQRYPWHSGVANGLLLRAEANFADGDDRGWGMVEAFSELRREQAKVFRQSL
jgi:hypothetical protein